MPESDLIGLLFGSMIIFMVFVIMLIALIPLYVWYSIELQKALKNLHYSKPWLAWIPYANMYAMAAVCDEENGKVKVLGYDVDSQLFKLWWLIALALYCIPAFGPILYAILSIICMGKCYINIYSKLERLSENDVAAKAYLSAIIVLVPQICLTLANRKAEQLGE